MKGIISPCLGSECWDDALMMPAMGRGGGAGLLVQPPWLFSEFNHRVVFSVSWKKRFGKAAMSGSWDKWVFFQASNHLSVS